MHVFFCPSRTKFVIVPAEQSSLGDYETGSVRVCVSVRAQNVEICFFSVIYWPILILFVLSDRAWWRLQNFYTEFWNSLIMQIYANVFKINEKCYFSISWPIFILFVLSDRAGWVGASKLLHRILKFIHYANLCKFIQNQQKMLLLYFLADFDSVCFIW